MRTEVYCTMIKEVNIEVGDASLDDATEELLVMVVHTDVVGKIELESTNVGVDL